MRGINISKFVGPDVQMFSHILGDMFMKAVKVEESDVKLKSCIVKHLETKN